MRRPDRRTVVRVTAAVAVAAGVAGGGYAAGHHAGADAEREAVAAEVQSRIPDPLHGAEADSTLGQAIAQRAEMIRRAIKADRPVAWTWQSLDQQNVWPCRQFVSLPDGRTFEMPLHVGAYGFTADEAVDADKLDGHLTCGQLVDAAQPRFGVITEGEFARYVWAKPGEQLPPGAVELVPEKKAGS